MTSTKISQPCQAEGFILVQIPFKTLGGVHSIAGQQIKKLASVDFRNNRQQIGEAIFHTFQNLGVLLAKGGAAIILNRVPMPEVGGMQQVTSLFITSQYQLEFNIMVGFSQSIKNFQTYNK